MNNLWHRWGVVRQRRSCHRTLRISQCPIHPSIAIFTTLPRICVCCRGMQVGLGRHRWHIGRMMAIPARWYLPSGFWLKSPSRLAAFHRQTIGTMAARLKSADLVHMPHLISVGASCPSQSSAGLIHRYRATAIFA